MNNNSNKGLWLVLLGLVLVVVAIIGYMTYLESKKDYFDSIYNQELQIYVEFGIVPQEKKLMEKNNLIPRIEQENYYFLVINEDNLLFTYYLDTYYSIDPRKGYVLLNEFQLNSQKVESILSDIKEIEKEGDHYKDISDYLKITYSDKKVTYIPKSDFLKIIQSYDILIDV